MLAKSDEIYQSLAGTDWEADALRLVAFFGVGSKLLDDSVQILAMRKHWRMLSWPTSVLPPV